MINNIYWVGNLNVIGGVETAIYELAKMFTQYDFVVYYNNIPREQLKRLKKYVRCVKYNGEKLKCKKFFCNYDISIIDNVEAEEYIEIVHAVFKYNVLKPHTHNKITKYYAVGKEACESFKEITGKECEVLHNPLQVEPPKKILRLISATRIARDKGKLVERMQKLVDALELANIPYEWKIFTNGQHLIRGGGIIYMTPRLDIRDYIADSDYLVQLSDTEAFCYSVLESLYLNVPVIVTPIPCFDEMGVENGKNGYILDFNMKEIPILDIYNKIPKFSYQPLENKWEDKIIKIKGNYKEELEMKKCEVIEQFTLNDFDDLRDLVRKDPIKKEKGKLYVGDTFVCDDEMCEYLTGNNAKKKVVVKVLETYEMPKLKEENIIPLDEENLEKVAKEIEKHVETKPKTTRKKKTSKK